MAFHCAHCRSVDVQALADEYGCLDCNGRTAADGTRLRHGRSTDVVTNDRRIPPKDEPSDGFTTTKSIGRKRRAWKDD